MNIIRKPFIILHTKKSLNRAVSFFYSKTDFIINTTKENIKSTDVNKICGECKAKYQQM